MIDFALPSPFDDFGTVKPTPTGVELTCRGTLQLLLLGLTG